MIRSFRVFPRLGLVQAVVIGSVLFAGTAATALGQRVQTMTFSSAGPGDGGMFRPPVTQREMDRYAPVLGLSDEQKASAKSLVDAVTAEFSTVAKDTREKMDEISADFNESHDPSVFREKMPAVMSKFREKSKAITDGFMNDLKLLLNPDQEAKWGRFERLRRRERSSGLGSLSGESVDLVRTSEKLGIIRDPNYTGASEQVRQLLEQYETDLDHAIQDRSKALESRASMRPGDGQPIDAEEARKAMDEIREKSKVVRDVNQKYARQLGALVGDPMGAKLATEVKHESFPQVYRDGYASKALAAASGMSDLTPEQKSTLQELQETYSRELAAAQDKWAAALQEADNAGESGGMVSGGSGGAMFMRLGDEPESIKAARKAKRELDDRAVEKINSTLTAAQREKLPPKRARTGGGPHGGDDEGEVADVMEIHVTQ